MRFVRHQHSALISLCHELVSCVCWVLAFNCFRHLWNCPPSSQILQHLPLRFGLEKEPVCSWLMQIHLEFLCPHNSSGIQSQPIIISLSDTNLSHWAAEIQDKEPAGKWGSAKLFPWSKGRDLSREQGNSCNNQAEKQPGGTIRTQDVQNSWHIPWRKLREALGMQGKNSQRSSFLQATPKSVGFIFFFLFI